MEQKAQCWCPGFRVAEGELTWGCSRNYFELALERVRQSYSMCVYGNVVIPEHVHLLVSEPERQPLARPLQSLKQPLALRAKDTFRRVPRRGGRTAALLFVTFPPGVVILHSKTDEGWTVFVHQRLGELKE